MLRHCLNDLSRRELLAVALGTATIATAAQDNFSFVHFTDLHIQPERKAAKGCAQCVTRINQQKSDFAICGGDLVFDAAEVGFPRAQQLFDLYAETLKPLDMKVYSAIGNHDVFGVLLPIESSSTKCQP
jgi:3',5'-cyclic-AMP phosphodiesterase